MLTDEQTFRLKVINPIDPLDVNYATIVQQVDGSLSLRGIENKRGYLLPLQLVPQFIITAIYDKMIEIAGQPNTTWELEAIRTFDALQDDMGVEVNLGIIYEKAKEYALIVGLGTDQFDLEKLAISIDSAGIVTAAYDDALVTNLGASILVKGQQPRTIVNIPEVVILNVSETDTGTATLQYVDSGNFLSLIVPGDEGFIVVLKR